MSKDKPRNLAASVRERLRKAAAAHQEEFQLVLTRYGLERLLYRLSRSVHAEAFVLKGAMLFQLWSDEPHRPTRDVDLLGRGDNSAEGADGVGLEQVAAVLRDFLMPLAQARAAGELFERSWPPGGPWSSAI